MGIFKRNLACLTFLMNHSTLSMQEILNNKQLPTEYEYELRTDIENIQILITEFMVCNTIDDQCLVVAKTEKESIELWATNKGFQIRFYLVNVNGLLELIKTVKADFFIKDFTTEEEFFRYVVDFGLTISEWLNGSEPKPIEPEHRDIALTELLAERFSKTESELQETKEKLVELEQQTKDLQESIKVLIQITEKLYLQKKGGN